jgi:hypothetical protein
MTYGATRSETRAGQSTGLRSLLWYALALMACLSVLAINGRPLFYWDTVGYIAQGVEALERVGLADPKPMTEVSEQTATEVPANGTVRAAPTAGLPTVDGSRSIAYSLLMGAFAELHILDFIDLLHALAVILAIWLPVRIARRLYAPDQPLPFMVTVPILVASLGSLPFVVSYLMPDIFAPIMLLMIATLTVFAREMRMWEIALTVTLGVLALVAHLSHLAIAAAMIPATVLVVFFFIGGRGWVGPVLVGLIVLAGVGQQAAFRAAATKIAKSEVVVKPFITARLIQDGVGYSFLAEACPDPRIETCKLYAQLQKSSDPWRLTASHILFKTDAQLGSLRLMTEEDQRLVARDQTRFFLAVLKDRPAATAMAFIKNTVVQAGMFSVDMTIPTENIIAQHKGVPGMIGGEFRGGRLSPDGPWLLFLTVFQGTLYAGSLIVISVLLVQRERTAAPLRALAVMLVLGVLANAFVCGGISQPASRYGMRVIWLLPLAATILMLFARYGRTEAVR